MKRAAIVAATLVAAAAPAQAAFPGRDGRIAYTSDWIPMDCGEHSCEQEVSGLHTIWPDGRGRRSIGRCRRSDDECDEREMAWSPDGRRIAFTHNSSIWVMRSNGTARHRIVEEGEGPAWSPDGRHIVFSGARDAITIARADGSHRRRLNRSRGNAVPTWSVGGLIAYTHYPLGSAPQSIVMRRLDGRLVRRFKDRNGVANPDFSPDGRLIAYERDGDGDGASIWVSRPDGSHRRRVVANGREPAWSPSGRFIAFSRPVGPFPTENEIFVVRRDGSHAHQVGPSPRRKTDPRGDYHEASWQPLPQR